MIIKQIAIDEALELHKRGLMVGILQPVTPEPKGLGDYELMTLKKLLDGCVFFRIMPEKEEIKDRSQEEADSIPPNQEKEKADTSSSDPNPTDTAISKPGNKLKLDMEIEKLRVAARDIREKAIVELLLSTGCRVTELVNIKLSEIDDDKILVHGKGQKDRYVYLNARAKLAVDMYVEQRKDKNPYLFPKGIFSKEGGEKHNWWMNPQNVVDGHTSTGAIEKITRSMAKRTGVERANPHKFRRTCATMALRRGMPIEQVSKMLGHECIATTQIYLDLTERDLKQAHEKYVI